MYNSTCLILVNGQWGNWEGWEDCTVTCGGGYQNRTRVCDNPAPAFGGNNCSDNGTNALETERCNENACLGKANVY